MRKVFIALLQEEKARGTTIFMSSHMFDEVEVTCDQVGVIKQGRIIKAVDLNGWKQEDTRTFKITFKNEAYAKAFLEEDFQGGIDADMARRVQVCIKKLNISSLMQALQWYEVEKLEENPVQTLEMLFKESYQGGNGHEIGRAHV